MRLGFHILKLNKMSTFNLDNFKLNKYDILSDLEQYNHFFDHTFELIENEWSNPTPKIVRTWREDWTSNPAGPILRNILYVNQISDQTVEDIKGFLLESGIRGKLESLFGYNIGVCNIRAYRYTHNPPDAKTHFEDNLDYGGEFQPHIDDFGCPVYKIMLYKSRDSELLTEDHGITQINTSKGWITPLTEESVLGVIFAPHLLYHRADNPKEGRIRDTIEITIIRRNNPDFLVVSAGAQAGRPKDFNKWDKMT